jgi:hypothetical protein
MKRRIPLIVVAFIAAAMFVPPAYNLLADVRTSKTADNPTYGKIYDLDDAVERTVWDMTPANSPAFNVTAEMLTVGGTKVTAATRFATYGAGTAYALTNTAAAIDPGPQTR